MAEFSLSRSYEQEEQEMDEEDRLTEEFDALKYFTMSKLKEFDREIQQLKKERKESDEIVSKEFGELKEKIEQLEEAAEQKKAEESAKEKKAEEAAKQKKVEEKPKHKMRISVVNTSDEEDDSHTPPKKAKTAIAREETPRIQLNRLIHTNLTPKTLYKIPQTVRDLSIEWQEKLVGFTTVPQKSDLLTEAQLSFFNFWTSSRPNLFANNAHVSKLIHDGYKADVWIKGWSPSPTLTLSEYFMNRLKSVAQKRRRTNSVAKLREEFAAFDEFLHN